MRHRVSLEEREDEKWIQWENQYDYYNRNTKPTNKLPFYFKDLNQNTDREEWNHHRKSLLSHVYQLPIMVVIVIWLDFKFLVPLSMENIKQKCTHHSAEPSFPLVSKEAFSFLLLRPIPQPVVFFLCPLWCHVFIHQTFNQCLCTRQPASY